MQVSNPANPALKGDTMMFGDTWSCSICKKERPDANISVHQIPILTDDGVKVGHRNVRYCNDNAKCFELARKVKA